MDYSEQKFTEHIKAVVEAAEIDDTIEERPLTLSELKELAVSMGLTDEQWDDLLLKAKSELRAADDHLKARNFSEAILHAEKATAINPYIENGNAVLAKAYLMLWLNSHDDHDRDKAEFHARKELKVDPRDQIAVNVLSTIEKKRKILQSDSNSRKKIFIGLGILLAIIVLVAIMISNQSDAEIIESENNYEAEANQAIRNQLIEAEEDMFSKWALVQVAIDRRNNLIPDLFLAIQTSSEDAEALNETIEGLQNEIKNADGDERYQLENDLNAKIQEAKELAKQNGDADNVASLMVQIEGSENRIAYEKKTFNESVKTYNILVKKNMDKFPEYEVKPYFNNN
jgi:LemA protein